MDIHTPATTDLKCPTCFTNFNDQVSYKGHYKSDYHRYNLKRKMVKLAPVTQEQFKAKRTEAQLEQQADFKCNQCGKKFGSVKTFDQHVQTKKHNPNMHRSQQTSKPKQQTVPKYTKNYKVCLFCLHSSENFSENLRHMQSQHSFFIAQPAYCTNQQKLIEYLQQKIEVGFMCITCQNKNARDFNSGEAVRKHMIDKGHTFMKIQQGFDQYLEYYDFSEQFKEIIELQKDKYVPGIEYTTLKVVAKAKDDSKDQANKGEDDGQWEDQESQNSQTQEQNKKGKNTKKNNKAQIKQGQEGQEWQSDQEEQQIKQQEQQQQIKEKDEKEEKKKNRVKTYHIMRPTHTANGQLLLPNGKILGHRKFRYLYRQTYRPQFWLNQNIKALGYEFANNTIISRQKLMELAKHDRLLFKTKIRWDKKQLRVGMQNNSLQKYYRSRNSL